jgi:hypothetical protein
MTLQLVLPPEFERRLLEEAKRRGQTPEECAQALLAQGLEQSRPLLPGGVPQSTPEQLLALVQTQGIEPVTDFEELLGDWTDDDTTEDTDVDAFLLARNEWKWEGSPGLSVGEGQ